MLHYATTIVVLAFIAFIAIIIYMFIALKNDGDKSVSFEAGDRICQAVFVPFGITVDDNADGVRTGGIGSTN